MQQSITLPIYTTITSKGQVTIPVKIRKLLGVKPHDKIRFEVNQTSVEIKPFKMLTLEEIRGSVPALKKPLSWKEMQAIVRDERAEVYEKKLTEE